MPSGQQVGNLGQLLEAVVLWSTRPHKVRYSRHHVRKQEQLWHGTVPLPGRLRDDTTREAGKVLWFRASLDHPGLEETADVILNLITAESHPAGQLFRLLCNAEPASALIREGRTRVGGQAPWGKGLSQKLSNGILARVVRLRPGQAPAPGSPASQGGGPASRAAADPPQAGGKEPQNSLQKNRTRLPHNGQTEANHI